MNRIRINRYNTSLKMLLSAMENENETIVYLTYNFTL
jgi:hypothetical protein